MLELLSGPRTIQNGNDPGSPVATLTDIATATAAFYDDLGLCTYSGTIGGYCVVQLDGMAHLRSYQSRANSFTLDMQRPGEWIIHESLFERALYEFNKGPGTFGDLVINTGVIADMTSLIVRTADRYLDVINGNVRWRPLDLSTATVLEAILTGAGSGRPTVSRTLNPNVICFVWGNGPVAYYDVNARAQVAGSGNVGTNSGGWYSPKHDIFVTLTNNAPTPDTVSVFANAVRPASISNPVAVSPLVQGRVSQVKVRLLGSNSDACADELVNWSITAGSGAMADAQTTTDADGWAYNDYIAPVSGGAGSPFGSVSIQAQVLF